MFYASLFSEYFSNYIKRRLTYRSDFWIEIVSDLLFQGMNLLFILIVFMHTPLLGGWSQEQVVFIYGYFMVPYGVFGCFFNLWNFSERYIGKGEMDRVLIRPAHNLTQLMLENLDPASLFGSLVGLFIMFYTGVQMDMDLSWTDPLAFLLFTGGAILIYGGVYIAITSVSFFSDAPTGILPLVWNIQNYGRYPVNIYNKIIKFTLTFLLPFAFVGFYPAAYFLDRANWGMMAFLTPVMGLIFFAIGLALWNYGVRKYRGAGS
ncbi:ABC transporter permease [Paenibacillus koleovorans]|uniref:ABC transporter permease n=1 Tax=Paenibacillus koleovorans TaxID=121608 RepID=UPI000FD759E6|nr:ABC-2 family transporter protein [Paenibacillus koleovorans]